MWHIIVFILFFSLYSFANYLPLESGFSSLDFSHGLKGNPGGIASIQSDGILLGGGKEKGLSSFFVGGNYRFLGASFDYVTDNEGFNIAKWNLGTGVSLFDKTLFWGNRLEASRSSAFNETELSFTTGILLRPLSFLSLGWTGYNLLYTGPENPSRIQEFGATLRYANYSLSYDFYDFEKHRLLLTLNLYGLTGGIEIPIAGGGSYKWTLSYALTPSLDASVKIGDDGRPHAFYIGYHRAKNLKNAGSSIVLVPLDSKIEEKSSNGIPFLISGTTGIQEVRETFVQLNELPYTSVIILDFSGYQGSFAVSKEISRGIEFLKKQNKYVVAFLDDIRASTLLATVHADKIIAEPSSRLNFSGFSGTTLFYKGFFDKLGVKVEFLRHGDYKSATERYTLDSMSREAKENLQTIYRKRFSVLKEEWKPHFQTLLDSLAEKPEITASAAKRYGLVDALLYKHQIAPFAVKSFYGIDAPNAKYSVFTVQKRTLFNESWGYKPSLALITIDGTITEETAKELEKDLLKVEYGPYKALILRINSPGGSAKASDRMWANLKSLKEKGFPIIASVGDYAASGGYYIACAANKIIAEKFSLVGSIGIYGGKVDFSGLLKKLNIKPEVVRTHPHADAESFTRSFDAYEKEALQNYMDEFYARFVNIVSEAIQKPVEYVDKELGEGRVFIGSDALKNGLIHKIGGIAEAISEAKKMANISESTKVRLVSVSDNKSYSFDLKNKALLQTLSDLSSLNYFALEPLLLEK